MNTYTFGRTCAAVISVIGLSAFGSAEEPLVTDRPDFTESSSTATFQTGLVYLFNSDLQADVRAAQRLTDRGVDFLFGAGLSWRLGG